MKKNIHSVGVQDMCGVLYGPCVCAPIYASFCGNEPDCQLIPGKRLFAEHSAHLAADNVAERRYNYH